MTLGASAASAAEGKSASIFLVGNALLFDFSKKIFFTLGSVEHFCILKLFSYVNYDFFKGTISNGHANF